MTCRDGEEEKTRFRSERLYIVDEKHYFSTREGTEIGPFGSRLDAEQGMQRYVKHINSEGGSEKKAHAAALQGDWASTNFE